MRFSPDMPLKYVSVAKVAENSFPEEHAGDLRAYYFGPSNPKAVLQLNYSIEGWLVAEPTLGSTVQVLRTVRNGVAIPGLFVSSPVTAVPNGQEFHTADAKYLWKVAVPEFTWPAADAPTPPRSQSASASQHPEAV
jgi:hypothetical protein